MPQPMVRKVVLFDPLLWGQVEDFRFNERAASEADAVRQLLKLGLSAWKGQASLQSANA